MFLAYVEDQAAKKSAQAVKITKMNHEINEAIQFVCSSKQDQEKQDRSEADILNINVDDLSIDLDLYKKIINKFFACIRHQIYRKLKVFWSQNQNTLMEQFEQR